MSKWAVPDAPGILRKRPPSRRGFGADSDPSSDATAADDLLVFGYACKLFRDDERARHVDQGLHLIGWPGDAAVRIDRYDGRAALPDLRAYEAAAGGAAAWPALDEAERRVERLCDEERYRALRDAERDDDEELYREEELKRRKQTNEFSFDYDVKEKPSAENPAVPTVEEEDRDYVPRPELDVPVDITMPRKEKENARIEKTALFVSSQGLQMEILIKTKQAGNPQFSFLNRHDPLHKYYKHVLEAIKSGRYRVSEGTKKTETEGENGEENGKKEDESRVGQKEDGDSENVEGHYLHPSLLQNTASVAAAQPPLPPPPTVTYRPTADCAYSQLVTRIQGASAANNPSATTAAQVATTFEQQQQQQQYYQYYYSVQYYEYYKQLVRKYHGMGGTDGQTIPPLVQEQINTQAAAFAQLAMSQYTQQQQQQQHNPNPYAQIVTNLSSATTPSEPTKNLTKEPPSTSTAIPPAKPDTNETKPPPSKEVSTTTTPIASLASYGSGSDGDTEEEDVDGGGEEVEAEGLREVREPPEDVRLVVEKMATYVSKNGADFESIVRSRGDPRFDFLNASNEFHAFYLAKVKEFRRGKEAVEKKVKVKEKKIVAPVSFSIKKTKEETPKKDIRSALPLEETDDEDDEPEAAAARRTTEPTTTTTKPKPEQHHHHRTKEPEQDSKEEETKPQKNENPEPDPVKPNPPPPASPPELPPALPPPPPPPQPSDPDDPILEMIDLTAEEPSLADAARRARSAEDRIRDRLAAAARERMASAARDRALQAERRRKAAAFLRLKLKPEEEAGSEKVGEEKAGLGKRSEDGVREEAGVNKDKGVRKRRKARKRAREKASGRRGAVSGSEEEESDKGGEEEEEKEEKGEKGRGGVGDEGEEEEEEEEGEIRRRRRSKKKKSYRRKRKRSRSRTRRGSSSPRKKLKRKRRRSDSYSSEASSKD